MRVVSEESTSIWMVFMGTVLAPSGRMLGPLGLEPPNLALGSMGLESPEPVLGLVELGPPEPLLDPLALALDFRGGTLV
jgi:hypothetical protein